ncbi:protein phosphatase 2C domain-containing protein [Streptomyces avermitilis]|uniref:protein phosphatase 2C domain-containing protein n=1 Tax=Streptomyces avermitilis TaxID=33903 RepID=UPI00381742E8
MSQQGERSTGHEDDWWGQLYDDSTADTGPAAAADSLDDRFASAAGTVGQPAPRDTAGAPLPPTAPPSVPEQRAGGGPAAPARGSESPAAPARGSGSPGRHAGAATRGTGAADASGGAGGADASGEAGGAGGAVGSGGRHADPPRRDVPARDPAPWEPPSARPPGPATFPPGRRPPGLRPDAPPPSPAGEGGVEPVNPGRSAPARPGEPVKPRPPVPPSPIGPPQPAPAEALSPSDAPPPPVEAELGRLRPPAPPVGPPSLAPTEAPAPTDAPPPPPELPDLPPPSLARAAAPPPPVEAPGLPPLPDLPPRDPTLTVVHEPPPVDHIGSGPPTYDAEPTALPAADPDDLDDLVADTVLDGARYGSCTLRAVSARGDSARYRGEPRRDSLLTARFGVGDQALLLVAMATGARATPGAHRAAAEACHWIGRAVGRSHARLAEDIRAARRGDLKSGLHRLTDRSLGKLHASAAEQGVEPEEYSATLRCLLLPADPECRTRVFFGVGAGGLFRLRDGAWQDIEPHVADATGEAVVGFGSLPSETPEGDRLTMDLGITTPPSPYEPSPRLSASLEQGGTPVEPPRDPFRFRASVAHPGDTLLLCSGGLAEPLRGEPRLAEHLTARWSNGGPPGLAAFLADTQVRVKGYADDRTAAAVWEA